MLEKKDLDMEFQTLQEVAKSQSNLSNFVKKFLNEDGSVKDNMLVIIKLFTQQKMQIL